MIADTDFKRKRIVFNLFPNDVATGFSWAVHSRPDLFQEIVSAYFLRVEQSFRGVQATCSGRGMILQEDGIGSPGLHDAVLSGQIQAS